MSIVLDAVTPRYDPETEFSDKDNLRGVRVNVVPQGTAFQPDDYHWFFSLSEYPIPRDSCLIFVRKTQL